MTYLTAFLAFAGDLIQTLQQNQTGAFLLVLILAALGFCIHGLKGGGRQQKK